MYFPDPLFFLLIIGMVIAGWAQFRVQSTFARYSKVASQHGLTGAELAGRLLRQGGLGAVRIERIPGNLTDHYDPRDQVLRLSDSVYGSRSIAALGVAAHEVGHAIQHEQQYAPLAIRNAIVPVANFGSMASFPLILLGLLIPGLSSLAVLGIVVFLGVIVFQLVTLPVEFNASNRAVILLSSGGYVSELEVPVVKKVLGAAALTYVAAVIVSLLNLIRLLAIVGIFRDE